MPKEHWEDGLLLRQPHQLNSVQEKVLLLVHTTCKQWLLIYLAVLLSVIIWEQ